MVAKIEIAKEELERVYRETGSSLKTAKHFGVSKKTILNKLATIGMDTERVPVLTGYHKDRMRQLVLDGASVREAAEEFEVSDTTVRNYAAKWGIEFGDSYHKGFITTWNGYRMLKFPTHPHADSKGYVREHILVMEDQLGRHLEPDEIVHHIDGNKTNNAPGNLQLTTRSEHAKEHAANGEIGWALYHANRSKT